MFVSDIPWFIRVRACLVHVVFILVLIAAYRMRDLMLPEFDIYDLQPYFQQLAENTWTVLFGAFMFIVPLIIYAILMLYGDIISFTFERQHIHAARDFAKKAAIIALIAAVGLYLLENVYNMELLTIPAVFYGVPFAYLLYYLQTLVAGFKALQGRDAHYL